MRTIYVICGWTLILAGLLHAGELAVAGSVLAAYAIAILSFIAAGFLVSMENGKEIDEVEK